ncbi:MAG: hypothetical protein IT371_10915 [Deltaproteobacteria bacterium]|nr:hypothetical protein [Deltaproteobacteria bacterium]
MQLRNGLAGVALATVTLATLVGSPGIARAGALEACGNVALGPSVQCEVEPPGVQCETRCTPVNMEVSCAKELFKECGPQCTFQVVEEEVQVCSSNCVTECEGNPGSFSCTASCGGKCAADCSAKCSTSANQSQCRASCNASCTGYCDVECKAVLPSMTCQQKCQPACRGVVVSRVNMDCQLKCHTVERYTNCSTRLTGGCKSHCRTNDGAIFCDGQFIEYANSFQQCLDALKKIQIKVNIRAAIDVSGCAVGGAVPYGTLGLVLVFAALLVWRRRD